MAIDTGNGFLSKINVKKIEELDSRPAKYASDEKRKDRLKEHVPYEYQNDLGRYLSRVDVPEVVQYSDEFLQELWRGRSDSSI